MSGAAQLLDAGGPLAGELPGFAPRASQQALGEAVEQALAGGDTLIAEAGTGVGKTIAYLLPVLRSGLRTIVSTGTRHLQDQLFHRDLPLLQRALGDAAEAALLKGRANYLCRYRLQQLQSVRARLQPGELVALEAIESWARCTRDGDVAEVDTVAESSPLWPRVTSTVENCLGAECPCLTGCHVLGARRAAQAARIVVVNHHLLFADLALKEEGFGEVLPDAEAFVLDEAHQLPEIAASFFGQQLSSRQLLGLAEDSRAEQLRDARDAAGIGDSAARLHKAARDLRLALGGDRQRAPWHAAPRGVPAVLDALGEALGALHAELEVAQSRGKGLEHCARRSAALRDALERFRDGAGDDAIRWYETFAQSFSLRCTPLDVAPMFRAFLANWRGPWIFTSATLTVGGRFTHFRERLGLDEGRELCLESPFDYRRNALLYLPPRLPQPADPGYSDAVLEAALPVLRASGGRAFVLVTSHRALQHLAARLGERLEHPVLVQGQAPKRELLARFRELGDAVLLGTASFWEGVDVRGGALSCVVIDKLPFASPGEPVLQARLEALRAQGEDPFTGYQLPQAVIALKQGIGRLIRDVDDRGVLVLCDPRLRTRGYGRLFLKSLPPLPVTEDLGDVQRFFAAAEPA